MYRELATGPINVDVSFEKAAELAAAYGFHALSLEAEDMEQLGVEKILRILGRYGLKAGVTSMPVDYDHSAEAFETTMAKLPEYAECFAAAGGTRVVTWIRPFHETLAYKERFEQLVPRMHRICEVLAKYDLHFGLEFIGPETLRKANPNPFVYDIKGMLSVIEAVDMPNLGFLLDAFHWYTSAGTAADLSLLNDNLVVLVHVNDAIAGVSREEQEDLVRTMPGESGIIDFGTFMGALVEMDYSGPVVVEPFCKRLKGMAPEQAVKETALSLDRIWPASI